ncbi:MAG: nucleotide exchange factor GrpE [Bacteroidales bacterium]|jgi:molecular chaperone GrpE|nr:nucleotide exchange factor GrpE [Bacteroidales bacterium]
MENEEKKDENLESQEQTEETVEQTDVESKEATEGEETATDEESVDDIEKLRAEYEELKDKHLRLQAEFDNFRRRTIKEKADLITTAGEKVLKDLLPVVDDLDRAMESVATAQDVSAVREGLDLIVNKFNAFLASNGVAEIEAVGLDLDTDKHNAIARFAAPTEDMKGKVIDVTKKGYTLNGKVIRHAEVVVGE